MNPLRIKILNHSNIIINITHKFFNSLHELMLSDKFFKKTKKSFFSVETVKQKELAIKRVTQKISKKESKIKIHEKSKLRLD